MTGLRRTKIVCTLGPASSASSVIEKMITGGMDVARLNFSHGTHEDHRQKIGMLRDLSSRLNRPVAILQDLSGPKIRIGSIPDPGIILQPGEGFILSALAGEGSQERVSVSYPDLPQEVHPGDPAAVG